MVITWLKRYKRYLLLAVADLLFFAAFSPTQSSWLLLPAFGLVFTTLYVLIKLILRVINQFITISPLLRKKITIFGTFVVGVVLALQSLGQLTVRDIITVVPLVAILYLYVSYFTLKRS